MWIYAKIVLNKNEKERRLTLNWITQFENGHRDSILIKLFNCFLT